LNIATTIDAMENEKRIATDPATRAILSRPGKERKVTNALKRIAAFHDGDELGNYIPEKKNILTMRQVQVPMTNVGVEVRRPLSSSSLWCWWCSKKMYGIPRHTQERGKVKVKQGTA
jgi:hypothetical protein